MDWMIKNRFQENSIDDKNWCFDFDNWGLWNKVWFLIAFWMISVEAWNMKIQLINFFMNYILKIDNNFKFQRGFHKISARIFIYQFWKDFRKYEKYENNFNINTAQGV